MLQDRYPRSRLTETLLPPDQWRPFPPATDRPAWEELQTHELNRRRAEQVVGKAELLLDHTWPTLRATDYMAYIRDGSRGPYEGPYFARRTDLGALVLAECFEHRGRFVDQIVNLLWAICEETTWCVPAHVHIGIPEGEKDPLGRLDREVVDLFAADTAMAVSEAIYLLASELDATTPLIRQRVRREVIRRVIDPVMDRADFSWLTCAMNWNTWCSSNVLGAGYYVLDDPDRVAELTWRMMGSTDAFLAGQPADGGCSEGPNYWGVAPGALVILLELLRARSGGTIDVYDEPLIRELGLYLPRVHMDGPWFATFADCPPLVNVKRAVVYRYGDRIGDAAMRNLALLEMRGWDPAGDVSPSAQFTGRGSLTHILRELFWMPPDAAPRALPRPRDVWLPDLQVMVARQSAEAGRGLVVAAKGGHNQEHHNHNDVGQFILGHNGRPVVADVGVTGYTRETFGPRRYEIWCIRGSGHNVPVVNGVEQAAGREFAATDVTHDADDAVSCMAMELARTYPPEAGVRTLRREIRLDRADGFVVVKDAYQLDDDTGRLEVHLFTPAETTQPEPGQITLTHETGAVRLSFDASRLTAEVMDWPIEDERLRAAWGGSLRRITLATVDAVSNGDYSLTFKPLHAP